MPHSVSFSGPEPHVDKALTHCHSCTRQRVASKFQLICINYASVFWHLFHCFIRADITTTVSESTLQSTATKRLWILDGEWKRQRRYEGVAQHPTPPRGSCFLRRTQAHFTGGCDHLHQILHANTRRTWAPGTNLWLKLSIGLKKKKRVEMMAVVRLVYSAVWTSHLCKCNVGHLNYPCLVKIRGGKGGTV